MNLGSLARPLIAGSRFFLVDYLPAYGAALAIMTLIWAGAPNPHLDFSQAWKTASSLGVGQIILLTLAVTLVAILGHPLQLAIVRLLEGQWPRVAQGLEEFSRHRQLTRRTALEKAATLPDDIAALSNARIQEIGAAGALLRRRFPDTGLVRATALGNTLAAAEVFAGQAYGLDAATAWPRLYPVLGDRVKAVIDDRRDNLDAAARLSATMAGTCVITIGLLARTHWWLLLALIPLAISRVAYVGAIQAAIAYGQAIETAFDLNRFDMLKALHLPMPKDSATERTANARLCDMWRQGVATNTEYQHPEEQP